MAVNVLVTGATGLVGAYIVHELNQNHPELKSIYILARGNSQFSARQRVENVLEPIMSSSQFILLKEKLHVVEGDITSERLGIDVQTYGELCKEIDTVFHSAAATDFNMPLDKIRKINVVGSDNVAKFAYDSMRSGNFDCLHHFSTVVVAGTSSDTWYEDQLDAGQEFRNTYEQTKYEAELNVDKWRQQGLSVDIHRIGIVVGDSQTGYTNNFKMLYQPLQLVSLGLFERMPIAPNAAPSICPVDYVAKAIVEIAANPKRELNKTYHIVNPQPVSLVAMLTAASMFFEFEMPECIAQEDYDFDSITPLQKKLLEAHLPYFNYSLKFDTSNARESLAYSGFEWPIMDENFLMNQFSFCEQARFIKRRKK